MLESWTLTFFLLLLAVCGTLLVYLELIDSESSSQKYLAALIFLSILTRFLIRISAYGGLFGRYDERRSKNNILQVLQGKSYFDKSSGLYANKDSYWEYFFVNLVLITDLELDYILNCFVILFPLLYIPVYYNLLREIFQKEREALISVTVISFFDYYLFPTTEIRPEGVGAVMAFALIALLLRFSREEEISIKFSNVCMLGALSFLILLVHFLSFILMIVTIFSMLWISSFSSHKNPRKRRIRNLSFAMGIFLAIGLSFSLVFYENLFMNIIYIQEEQQTPWVELIRFFSPVGPYGIRLLLLASWSAMFVLFGLIIPITLHWDFKNWKIINKSKRILENPANRYIIALIVTSLSAAFLLFFLQDQVAYYRSSWIMILLNAWKVFIIFVVMSQFRKIIFERREDESMALLALIPSFCIAGLLTPFVFGNLLLRYIPQLAPFLGIIVGSLLLAFIENEQVDTRNTKQRLKIGLLFIFVFYVIMSSLLNVARPSLFYRETW